MWSFDKKISKNVFAFGGGVYAILLTIRKIGSGNVPFNVLRNQIVDFVIGSPGNVMWYIGVMLFISLLLKLIIVFDKNIHKAMAVWFVISVLLFVFSVLWDYVCLLYTSDAADEL